MVGSKALYLCDQNVLMKIVEIDSSTKSLLDINSISMTSANAIVLSRPAI